MQHSPPQGPRMPEAVVRFVWGPFPELRCLRGLSEINQKITGLPGEPLLAQAMTTSRLDVLDWDLSSQFIKL